MSQTTPFSVDQECTLAALLWQAIDAGLRGAPQPAVPGEPWLRQPAATFVTLHLRGDLRGCIGNLEARDGLGTSVVRNTHCAAFDDPRFAPLRPVELHGLTAEISVLTPMAPLAVHSRPALLAALRPRTDGLLVRGGGRSATFLPAVWDDLPEPAQFVDHLWRKAGLAAGAWPADMAVWTYQAHKIAAVRPAASNGDWQA